MYSVAPPLVGSGPVHPGRAGVAAAAEWRLCRFELSAFLVVLAPGEGSFAVAGPAQASDKAAAKHAVTAT